MIKINLSEARKNFSKIANRAYLGEEYLIMLNGSPLALMRGLTKQEKKDILNKLPQIR